MKARLITGRVISAVSPAIAAVIVGIALAILFIPALVPALAFVGTAGAIGILASGVVVLVGGLALGLLMFALSKKTENEATKILQDGQPQAAQEDESATATATATTTEPEAVKPDYINDEDWNKCPDELKQLIADNTIQLEDGRDGKDKLFLLALHLLIEIKSNKQSSQQIQNPLGANTTTSSEISEQDALRIRLGNAYSNLNDNEKAVFDIISNKEFIYG